MLNLKYLLILALISLGFLDDNCLVSFQVCDERNAITSGSIKNCVYYYVDDDSGDETCYECESGYALSYDEKQCIKFKDCLYLLDGNQKCGECKSGFADSNDGTCKNFDNCLRLEEGDQKCSECHEYYYPDENGICKWTLCSSFDEDNVCTRCYDGYYFNKSTKQCEKISIPYCLELDEEDNTKCARCVEIISPDANGKCNLPSTLITGCEKYNDKGGCTQCQSSYEKSADGNSCTIKSCKRKVNTCYVCKPGFEFDENEMICVGYDGTKDSKSNSNSDINKIKYALLISILGLLI